MARRFAILLVCFTLLGASAAAQTHKYLGFDRNDFPGDAALPALHRTFSYSSYWLNPPPGETRNTWAGKRATLEKNGFGFLVLFTGRTDAQLRGTNAAPLGAADGQSAAVAARREGFPSNVLIFLDQEEGGRLFPEQMVYLFAWIDVVRAAGARAGVYCSGIPVRDGNGTISTAESIAERLASVLQPLPQNAERGPVVLWIADDRCPPSPGCSMKAPELPVTSYRSANAIAHVWQYAQSPRRGQFSAACPQNQAPDGNCYAPGLPQGPNTPVDLDTADSADPSAGR
jgi:glycoside hydrolase-like protein